MRRSAFKEQQGLAKPMNKTTPVIIIAMVLLLVGAWAIFSKANQGRVAENNANQGSQTTPGQGTSGMNMGEQESVNPTAAALTRSDNGEENVSVSATYITTEFIKNDTGQGSIGTSKFDLKKNLVFLLSLNTHSVDLSQIKLADVTVIKTGDGKSIKAAGWAPVAEALGHHRSGFILFPSNGKNGEPIISTKTRGLTVVVKDIAGVDRTFNWSLPIKY